MPPPNTPLFDPKIQSLISISVLNSEIYIPGLPLALTATLFKI